MSGPPTRTGSRPSETGTTARPRTVVRVRPRDEASRPPARPAPSRPVLSQAWTRRLAVVVAVLVGLLAVQTVVLLERDAPRAVDQAPVESVAGDAVLSILQLAGGGTLNTAILTDDLRASLEEGSASFVASLQDSGYSPRGGPVEMAVVEQTSNDARVLVAAAGDIRDAEGRAVGSHQLTFDLELLRIDGTWLVAALEVIE